MKHVRTKARRYQRLEYTVSQSRDQTIKAKQNSVAGNGTSGVTKIDGSYSINCHAD